MRVMFGLSGILVSIAVLAMAWSYYAVPTIQTGQTARIQAEQIAGFDQSGSRVTQTVVFQPIMSQGRLLYLLVQQIWPSSSYGSYYGIVAGDMIETIGPQSVRDIGDETMAKALAYEAYQRQWDLVIIRNERKFVLPRDAAPAAGQLPLPARPASASPAAASPPGTMPPAGTRPSPEPQKTGNPLYDQLEAIRKYNQEK
jgi:hypothetical protein